MVREKFSPQRFILVEFFVLLPSVLFVFGIIMFIFGNPFLLSLVISPTNLLKNIYVEFVSPVLAGFIAYNYLEREKPKGFWKLKAKGILFYSILVIGLVILSYFF